ncbi:MAG TPA: dihydrofolate reductase family protein [Pyrinomonadaceae bacterium]|jgi:dihydrofolate reductase|nr:dihydrofolate reductase family protein [Pyrinomonadaceae bacterium]
MRKLIVFNNISLDGYFTDANSDMSWAHENADEEWNNFTSENASGGGVLLFGRKTYDLMVSFWPTKQAYDMMPQVAEGMNNLPKVVFSRTMDKAEWNNTKLVKGNIVEEVSGMKSEPGDDMVIMGSGTIVSQLTQERLIDEYQIIVHPLVLGSGRTLFQGVKQQVPLKRVNSRTFGNGNVLLTYVLE